MNLTNMKIYSRVLQLLILVLSVNAKANSGLNSALANLNNVSGEFIIFLNYLCVLMGVSFVVAGIFSA